MAGLDSNRGAKRAREAREELGLDPAAPLECLLDAVEERAGLRVVVAALPEDLAGACTQIGDQPLLFLNGSQGQAKTRQRFTLAHELGHVRCKHDGRLPVDTFATINGKTTNPYEVQANAFAAEFLIPRAGMDELDPDPTLDELIAVAADYGTSTLMTFFRFKQCDLLSATREAALQDELNDPAVLRDAYGRVAAPPIADRLSALGALPYVSPGLRDTHLGAALSGDAAADPALAAAIGRLLHTG